MSEVPIKVISSRLPGAPRPKASVAMITYNHENFIRLLLPRKPLGNQPSIIEMLSAYDKERLSSCGYWLSTFLIK
jgi:hypothetical protein